MASRYDYQDPGTDPTYCNQYGGHPGIERHCTKCGESVWVSRDEEYQVQVFCERCAEQPIDPPVDPAEAAAHNIWSGVKSLELFVSQAEATKDLARLHVLKKMTREAFDRVNDLDLLASEKVDALVERRR